jgi:phosphatidate cytidylyltransferase
MLKKRLLTAAILVPLIVWGILQLSTPYLALVLAAFVIQAGWEWGGLMKISSHGLRFGYAVIVGLCLAGVWVFVSRESTDWLALPVISLFWWILAVVWVITFPKYSARWSLPWVKFFIGLLVLVPTWLAVVGLHEYSEKGPYLVLYLLSLIWVADSGAYFGGRRWGKHKLAVSVSPGKTWEGVISALAASTIYAMVAANLFSLPGNQWPAFIVLSLVAVAFSIVGDLSESMFKRHANVKDSGALLPGHGGVLDRIDSVTAAAPVFVVGLWLGDFNFGALGLSDSGLINLGLSQSGFGAFLSGSGNII